MIYYWYKILNRQAFEATGLVSRTYTLDLERLGVVDILVTKGNLLSLTYEGVMLPVYLNNENPFEFEGLAVYEKLDGDIYLGVLSES